MTSVVFSTAPDEATAKQIARTLVEERLVACVNVVANVTSVYRWQGKIEEAGEILLVMKTVGERIPALAARLKELHPYEVPELLALPVDAALPAYAQWVVDETARVIT
jgi:periplasmic divalent cation tolerance protein